MAIKKLTDLGIADTVLDSDTLIATRGNLTQRIKKSDLIRGLATEDNLATERSRIDKLIAIPEGSTTGDAELIDARIGVDGIEYESVGTAMRTQIKALQDTVGEGGLNLEELVLNVSKDSKGATIFMSDGNVEKYAELPLPVDSTLSISSVNPVQNMIVTQELNNLSEELEILKNEGIGGETGTTIRLTNQNNSSTLISSYGSAAILMFTFTSTQDDLPSGNGNCKIIVNGIQKLNVSIPQGLNSIDVSPYLSVGSNSVVVTCSDVFGKSRSLAYDVTVIQLVIESTFDATVPYSGDITFKYTPYGSIDKTIYFVIDGEQVGTVVTSLSGKQMTRTIPAMTHGSHKLEVYSTATMDETTLESPKLIYDIICTKDGETTPIIASAYDVESVSQGEQISIPYIVYDPTKLACDITLTIYTMESGSQVVYNTQTITVDRSQKYWHTRKYPLGNVYFKIQYGNISKTYCVVVEESKIKIEAETNDLELLLTSDGRSNDELNPSSWTYGDITTNFSNMNWSSVGWMSDENGDTCLRLNGDARAEIQFQPFAEDLRTYGKTLELEFVIRDVNNRDTTVISCMSGGLGIEVKPDTAYLVSEQSKVFCNYKDEERVRIAFVVESKSEYRLLSIYLNGVLSDVVQYPTTDNFQQLEPVNISVGSSDCGIDLYVVRSYTTALPSHSIVTNYLADMVDVVRKTEIYEANDIYDDYGKVSFSKAREKNNVMVIVGNLPQSKGDKKTGKVVYYDVEDSNLNFEDTMTIDVQGTSSQFYVRKNWKLKFANEHYIDVDQLPAKVICIKVDYAEATGTHNTQNAVFVERLYSEQVPAQEDNPKVRTTIYGKPILLFHQEKEGETPTFYGKANFNYDKGAESVFGFTEDYDVECWEFCNNTSDACNFLGAIPNSWGDDFEARYPDGYKNISRFKKMHDWVVSTNQNAATGDALIESYTDVDGNVHTNDTAEYRLAKFKTEFEDYFNMHYALIYYVYTFIALMVDQRAKNMFLTYWGKTGKYYFYFYDNDTCWGINNEGQLVFDYYHEDTDTLDGANVYNGQNSTLWCNFREAFADEIQEMYQKLRNDGLITFDLLEEQFITKGSDKWSESIFNEDGEFKYVSMVKTDNDTSNLSFARGDGEQHFRYFVENRLNYLDSKWYASDYANDYISLRIYTPSKWVGVEPNADITVTPYSNMYVGVRYKANGTLYQEKVEHGTPITFEAPDETFNDTETAIYGASQLSSLGDLAPLYCGTVNVASATKLTEIKIGDGTQGYVNNNLKELSVGTNKLLKKIDIQNCPSFASPLGLAGCQNIEEIYAKGSGITGVELANSGYLKIVQLPATIVNLTMKNQEYIQEFSMEGYGALKTLLVENCPGVDTLSILDNATNLERVRLTGVEWSYPNVSFLYELMDRKLAGIDENGANIDKMWIDGKCHITTLTGDEMAKINAMYPYLAITYDNLTADLIFMSEDGKTELCRQTISNGGNGTDPIANGTIETPTKESSIQYDYTFDGWSLTPNGEKDDSALIKVEADRKVYAHFHATLRKYTVTFYNGEIVIESQIVEYGKDATIPSETPKGEDYQEFTGWKPSPTNIQSDLNCYAQYCDTREIKDSWSTIKENCINGTASSKYAIGAYKKVYIGGQEAPYSIELNNHSIEYKGKMYLIYDYNKDIVYDGENFETHNIDLNNNINTEWCVCNDIMYGIRNNTFWKFDGVTKETVKEFESTLDGSTLVTLNNEVHMFNLSKKTHSKFNGETWTDLPEITPPIGISFGKGVINGEFYFVTFDGLYKFNEITNGFDLVLDKPGALNGYPVGKVFKNELYVFGVKNSNNVYTSIYKTNGKSWEKVGDFPEEICNSLRKVTIGTLNGKLYLFEKATPTVTSIWLFDEETKEWTPPNTKEILEVEVADREHDELGDGSFKWEKIDAEISLQRGKVVVYNNEIHAFVGTSHHKWDGTKWTKNVSTLPFSLGVDVVLYNNEFHIFNGTQHYKYSNSEWVSVSTLPYNVNMSGAVVYNDEIHLIGGHSAEGCHYKWDGSEWTSVSTSLRGYRDGNCFIYNDKICVCGLYISSPLPGKAGIYAYDGVEWSKYCGLPNNQCDASMVVYNDNLYAFGSDKYQYKLENDVWIKVATIPFSGLNYTSCVYDNEIHFFGSLAHYRWSTVNWKNLSTTRFGSQDACAIVYNDGVYVVGGWNGQTTMRKFNMEDYTLEATIDLPYGFVNKKGCVVYDGKLHLLGGDDGNKHCSWDGESWTEVSTLPITKPLAIVYHNELHILLSDSHYKWSGTEWINVETLPYKLDGNQGATVYKDELYIFGKYSGKMFLKWNGIEWKSFETMPYGASAPNVVVYKDKIHLIGGGGYNQYANANKRHFVYDGETWTDVKKHLGNDTCGNTDAGVFVYRGKLYAVAYTYLKEYTNPQASLTFIAKNLLKEPRKMNYSQKTENDVTSWISGGWGLTDMRNYLNNDFYEMLPSELKEIISTSTKYADGGFTNKQVVPTQDKIWLLSNNELGHERENILNGQGKQYPIFTTANTIKRLTTDGQKSGFWTRTTTVTATSGGFWVYNDAGTPLWYYTNGDNGVLIGFCI